MSWFETLVGTPEGTRDEVLAALRVEGEALVCPDGRRLGCGALETPRLSELRDRAAEVPPVGRPSTVREVVGDVQALHLSHPGALFQAASQFNLLEMVGPDVTPDRGVTVYASDRTQGPACAIACGAGTIYRNYFAPVGGEVGQTARRQIDCLADVGEALGNDDGRLWEMRNGYALASEEGLQVIGSVLETLSPAERDGLAARLRVGVHWRVEVTLPGGGHRVTQVYGSALPVAYGRPPARLWEPFARLVLDASYEATLHAAVLQANETGCSQVFLTLLGGGVFGNEPAWIFDAIRRAVARVADRGLEIAIVSYGQSQPAVAALVAEL